LLIEVSILPDVFRVARETEGTAAFEPLEPRPHQLVDLVRWAATLRAGRLASVS
jgi:hypothetical protein